MTTPRGAPRGASDFGATRVATNGSLGATSREKREVAVSSWTASKMGSVRRRTFISPRHGVCDMPSHIADDRTMANTLRRCWGSRFLVGHLRRVAFLLLLGTGSACVGAESGTAASVPPEARFAADGGLATDAVLSTIADAAPSATADGTATQDDAAQDAPPTQPVNLGLSQCLQHPPSDVTIVPPGKYSAAYAAAGSSVP
jgi:hypothetical protein